MLAPRPGRLWRWHFFTRGQLLDERFSVAPLVSRPVPSVLLVEGLLELIEATLRRQVRFRDRSSLGIPDRRLFVVRILDRWHEELDDAVALFVERRQARRPKTLCVPLEKGFEHQSVGDDVGVDARKDQFRVEPESRGVVADRSVGVALRFVDCAHLVVGAGVVRVEGEEARQEGFRRDEIVVVS